MEHVSVDVNRTQVHCLVAGDSGAGCRHLRAPLLLLHGGGTDSASLSWGPHIDLFSAERTVIAPDLPGYGRTALGSGTGTVEHYVGFVRDLMDSLGAGRAVVGGISMGGAVALGLALLAPERISGLLLVDCYGLGKRIPVAALAYAFVNTPLVSRLALASLRWNRRLTRRSLESIFHDRTRVTEGLVDEVSDLLRSPSAGRSFMSFQRSEVTSKGLRTDYSGRLHEIRCPTLIVHGEHDGLVPVAWARRAHTRMPGSVLHVMPDCGHWPHREQPEEFNRVCAEFLSRL